MPKAKEHRLFELPAVGIAMMSISAITDVIVAACYTRVTTQVIAAYLTAKVAQ